MIPSFFSVIYPDRLCNKEETIIIAALYHMYLIVDLKRQRSAVAYLLVNILRHMGIELTAFFKISSHLKYTK
jgi:hypothetical protein